MQTRRLGNSDLAITPIGFGAWAIGGGGWAFAWGAQDDADSVATIREKLRTTLRREPWSTSPSALTSSADPVSTGVTVPSASANRQNVSASGGAAATPIGPAMNPLVHNTTKTADSTGTNSAWRRMSSSTPVTARSVTSATLVRLM